MLPLTFHKPSSEDNRGVYKTPGAPLLIVKLKVILLKKKNEGVKKQNVERARTPTSLKKNHPNFKVPHCVLALALSNEK